MCLTHYQVNYCEKCVSYIRTFVLGTVFCDDQQAQKACETRIQLQEIKCPGPCAACRQPCEVMRRSQRIYSLKRTVDYSGMCEDEDEDREAEAEAEAEAK